MADIDTLKLDAKDFSILYVEDDKKLRDMASALFKKIFTNIYVASDGEEALAIYKKYYQEIIITDTDIQKLSGMELIKKIKQINPDVKIIVMSIHDNKEYLLKAIDIGVFKYLKKPLTLSTLMQSIHLAVKSLKYDEDVNIFYTYEKEIYDYKNSMIVLLNDNRPIIANKIFLNYFEVENTHEFNKKYPDMGNLFLTHQYFLYNKENKSWIDELNKSNENLYNVQLKDKNKNKKHFMFKYKKVSTKEGYAIASFDDITDLNLMELFNGSHIDEQNYNEATIKLLNVIKRNSVKVNLHNYYKGLSITNDAFIVDTNDNIITLQTNYMQQKTIQSEKRGIIVSKALPRAIICENVTNIGFKSQSVEFKDIHFIETSPISRKTIRISPEPDHTVSLILHKHRIKGEMIIKDISVDAIKLKLSLVPNMIKQGDTAILDMILHVNKRPLIINTKVTIFKLTKIRYGLELVLTYDLSEEKRKKLVEYITKRLVYIIKEFKKIQDT